MEDQGSWKGHSFTLIVFIGIVILCSIFFVLGMVVGRGQVQHAAETPAANAAAKSASSDSHAPLQIEKGASSEADKDTPIVVDRSPVTSGADEAPAPAKAAAKAKSPEPPPAPAKDPPTPAIKPSGDKMTYVQVGAFEQLAIANKQADELRKKGFHVIVQSGDGAKKLNRVQVGPFSNAADVDIAKRKLEALGYPTLKK